MTRRILTCSGQVVLYVAFAVAIAVFSNWPTYRYLPEGDALIRLSMVHHAQRVHECEAVSAEELAALPPNMRAPMRCPRQLAPLTVEIDIDGALVHRQTVSPSGLSGDGQASVYRRLTVPAGVHHLSVRLRDSVRTDGFDFERNGIVDLAPAQILVVDFDAENGAITFR
jgi:hypothetical protein